MSHRDSPAVNILRKYFSKDSILGQEYSLYRTLSENVGVSKEKADMLIGAALKAGRRLNKQKLDECKYKMISEIRASYDELNFFSASVPNYKALAAFYCLLEAENTQDVVDPNSIVTNKVTLLEYMTAKEQSPEDVTADLIKEFSESDKDLRLLTFKVLLEKFNNKYANLLPEQKEFLKQMITLGESKGFRGYLSRELSKISLSLQEMYSRLPKGIERIKLGEVQKIVETLKEEKMDDTHLVKVLELYDLVEELKKVVG